MNGGAGKEQKNALKLKTKEKQIRPVWEREAEVPADMQETKLGVIEETCREGQLIRMPTSTFPAI